ncbi:HNH endonuclease [Paenibacillus oenotherae]
MRDHGLCQHCKLERCITVADMVHHRFPVRSHWHLRLVLSNLVSLCNSCHAKIDHGKIGG